MDEIVCAYIVVQGHQFVQQYTAILQAEDNPKLKGLQRLSL